MKDYIQRTQIENTFRTENASSVTLTKNSRGTMQWEIKQYADNLLEALEKILQINKTLEEQFSKTEKKTDNPKPTEDKPKVMLGKYPSQRD